MTSGQPSRPAVASRFRFRSSMVCDKVRIRFRKDGDLRLVSHHDLMRCFERMLRRAELPYHSTSGFHPKPRLVFALSLPLGVVGCDEVVELELDAVLPPEEIHERLARQAPAGLAILSVRCLSKQQSAQVRNVLYRIALPATRTNGLERRLQELLESGECWVERTRPTTKRINARPYLRDLRLTGQCLEMDLLVTPTGTARADDVLRLLELDDILGEGAVLERLRLELYDEITEHESAAGDQGPTSEGCTSAAQCTPTRAAEPALTPAIQISGLSSDS